MALFMVNPANLFMIQARERRLLALLKRFGYADLATKKIFEIGCGTGFWLREFVKWGGRPQNIRGIDLLVGHVEEAKRLCPDEIRIECGSAGVLSFPNATFDLVLQSTVFSSVLDLALREKIACEMLRVVKDDGLILWYDFHMNNPWNPDVQGVKKKEISQLFPDCHIELHRITLAPPVVRLLAPHSWLTCYILEPTFRA